MYKDYESYEINYYAEIMQSLIDITNLNRLFFPTWTIAKIQAKRYCQILIEVCDIDSLKFGVQKYGYTPKKEKYSDVPHLLDCRIFVCDGKILKRE